MSTARIAIIDEARLRIGSLPLRSESAVGGEEAIRLYDSALRLLVGLKPFSFARQTFQLARVDPLPQPAFWTYAYKLPPERLGPPVAVFDSRSGARGGEPFTDWELAGDTLATDAETIWCTVQVLPAPELWSPLFRECLILLLAAMMAGGPVREEPGLAADFRRQVFGDDRVPGDIGLLQKAATADAQGQPSTVMQIDGGPLIAVRFTS